MMVGDCYLVTVLIETQAECRMGFFGVSKMDRLVDQKHAKEQASIIKKHQDMIKWVIHRLHRLCKMTQ